MARRPRADHRDLARGLCGSNHHVDLAAGIDLNDREGVLGELDVILGQAVQRLADPGAEAGPVGFGAGGTGDSAERRGAVLRRRGRQALADAAHHAGQQRIGEHLALLGDQAPAHADLAVLAIDAALDLHFQRGAVGPHAGQVLGAQIGALGADVTVAGRDHEAVAVFAAEAIRQHAVVREADQHRVGVGLGLAAGGRIEPAQQGAARETHRQEGGEGRWCPRLGARRQGRLCVRCRSGTSAGPGSIAQGDAGDRGYGRRDRGWGQVPRGAGRHRTCR